MGMQKRDWCNSEFDVLVTLGESIAAGGWSSSRNRCWASRLALLISDMQSHPARLVNSGIGANVISTRSPAYEFSGKPAATERLDRHVIRHNPSLLIISYGLNDARGGTQLESFVAEMKRVIDIVRQKCSPLIVLLGPYFITDYTSGGKVWSHGSPEVIKAYNEAVSEVCGTKDCLFVDVLSAYRDTEWMVHDDGVHANDLGHLVIANRILEVLAQNCSCLAKHTKEKEKHMLPWRDESALTAEWSDREREFR